MQKMRSIFDEARISEKSFGISFFMEESDAPVISHSRRTSHSAMRLCEFQTGGIVCVTSMGVFCA